ncbi:SusC/RagA family TonB-linked outer membrane protein [Flavobacterium sp. RHBU_24]|uniref:SusC/RagA family TonB-linked outer membrane protein n=1 Tax=Flavobacterium sp. RHBU_24 TaxID=3391185 RepID=UPI003984E47B
MMLKLKFALIALLMISTHSVMAQVNTVTGVVTDSAGLPLPGASVNVEGSSNSASTDIDGKYTISGVSSTDKLVFSFIGTATQTISVGNQTTINVTLAESAKTLEDVVIVAYGSQKRTKVTGAIAVVGAKDIAAVPITNAESALQGRAAGVNVVNGAPGSDPTVTIRGLATMGNSSPLYVVDGVLVGNLSGLSPNDIESISVLKDASTTALYGSKAFNGVIMVTTKKGKNGPGQLTFNTYVGTQKVTKRYDVLNTQQYLQYAAEAFGANLTARAAEFGNQTTDWQDEIFQTGMMQDYNLAYSSGTENSTSRYSAEYLKQEGALIQTEFERYSFRSANTQTIGKLTVGSNMGISFNKRAPERAAGGRTLLEHAIKSAPYLPIYNEANISGYAGPTSADSNDAENPVRVANLGYQRINGLSIIGNIFAELEIIKGLKYRSQVSLDYYRSTDHTFVPSYNTGVHVQAYSTTAETNSQGQTIVYDNSLNYKTTIAEKHNIEVVGVITKIDSKFHNVVAGSRYAISDEIDQLRNNQVNLSSGNTVEANLGYVGRINYDYDEKYLFAVSGRRDASSRFGANNRWGNFYSVAAGWNIAKESFMANSVFSTLKLRASTGTTGNDRIDNYQYSGTLNAGYNYPIGGVNGEGVSLGRAANPNLKWESKRDTNFGLDVGLFDEQFTAAFEIFNTKAEDILFNVPLPASVGSLTGFQTQNIADAKTNGFEITLGYNDTKGDFTWSATGNIGRSKNEVTKLAPGIERSLGGPGPRAGVENFSMLEVGQPMFYFFGYETNGIYQNQAEVEADLGTAQTSVQAGDIRFVDQDGNGIINSDDKVNLGNPYPDFTYGLNLNAGYKHFDFNAFISGVQGVDVFNANKFDLEGMQRLFNAGTGVLDRAIVSNGVVTNPSASLPRAFGATGNSSYASRRYIEDGSYARLKNVTLGYTLSGDMFKKYFSSVRFYVSGQNLVTLTNYSGLDPEIARTDGSAASAGIDIGRYPQPKSVIFGLNVTF